MNDQSDTPSAPRFPKFVFKDELPLCTVERYYKPTRPTEFIHITGPAEDLICRFADGDELALAILLSQLNSVIGNVVEVMRRKPDEARKVTRRMPSIPVRMAPNKGFRDAADAFVDLMQVADDIPLAVKSKRTKGRGRPSGADPATWRNELALWLFEYIAGGLNHLRWLRFLEKNVPGQRPIPDTDIPGWLVAAQKLAPIQKRGDLTEAVAHDWASTAILVLEESFGPDLSVVPRLASLGASGKRHYRNSPRALKAAANRKRRRESGTAVEALLPEPDTTATMKADVNSKIRAEIRKTFRNLGR